MLKLADLLASNEATAALAALLAKAPVNARSQAVKDQALGQVLRVLMHVRGANGIESCIAALPEPLLDPLMKYIYRGFEVIQDNHAHLLTWHEKAVAKGQIGCVVRALTDRKRV
uniref:Actin-related protein 2/3 complex subunit 5 n=1 Tax=Macrostomum lignano TaxID=282301 RepID=A0A1I8IZ47_9PLAT